MTLLLERSEQNHDQEFGQRKARIFSAIGGLDVVDKRLLKASVGIDQKTLIAQHVIAFRLGIKLIFGVGPDHDLQRWRSALAVLSHCRSTSSARAIRQVAPGWRRSFRATACRRAYAADKREAATSKDRRGRCRDRPDASAVMMWSSVNRRRIRAPHTATIR